MAFRFKYTSAFDAHPGGTRRKSGKGASVVCFDKSVQDQGYVPYVLLTNGDTRVSKIQLALNFSVLCVYSCARWRDC